MTGFMSFMLCRLVSSHNRGLLNVRFTFFCDLFLLFINYSL